MQTISNAWSKRSSTSSDLNNLSNWPSITSNAAKTKTKRKGKNQLLKEDKKSDLLFSETSSADIVLSEACNEDQPVISSITSNASKIIKDKREEKIRLLNEGKKSDPLLFEISTTDILLSEACNEDQPLTSESEKNKPEIEIAQTYADNRTREEILHDRKIRRQINRENLRLQNLEKARQRKIAEKTSQQIRIIDQSTLDDILRKSNEQCEPTNFFVTDIGNEANNQHHNAEMLEKKCVKKKDPVTLGISEICTVKQKQKKEFVKPKDKTEDYGANTLDSANPVRHRGKKRENKKKRPSKLKIQILECRKLNKMSTDQVEINTESSLNSKEPTDEIHCLPELSGNVADVNGGEINQICAKLETIQCDTSNAFNKPKSEILNSYITFTRRFREYCDNCITVDLNDNIRNLLSTLVGFQERQFQKDPLKARTKKRLVVGYKETTKALKLKKACMIIIAPDMEKLPQEGGTFELVENLKRLSLDSGIPYLFSLERKQLGFVTLKKVLVSCIAILNKDGAEDIFSKCLELLHSAREQFSIVLMILTYESVSSFKYIAVFA